MFGRVFVGLQNHGLVGKAAIAVITAIGLLHLAAFFIQQVVGILQEVYELFA